MKLDKDSSFFAILSIFAAVPAGRTFPKQTTNLNYNR
jgi:hypothetical protein